MSEEEQRKSAGRPAHEPTEDTRRMVRALAGYGLRRQDIGYVIGVSDDTLRRYYSEDLEVGDAKAKARVTQTMFEMAVSGKNFNATKFWLEARAGWRTSGNEAGGGMVPSADPGANPSPPAPPAVREAPRPVVVWRGNGRVPEPKE